MLARALNDQGRYADAIEASKASEESAGDDPSMKAEWGPARAVALAHEGDAAEAEKLAREALDMASEPEDVLIRGYALESLAEVLIAAGKKDEAAPLLDEALSLYEGKGVVFLIDRVKKLQAT
jgi:tetratricopeptide (TPR) repeat protein